MKQRVVSVSGHVYDSQVRRQLKQSLSGLRSPHSRHDDICDEQINLMALLADQVHGFFTAARLQDGIAAASQSTHDHVAKIVLVFYHHNGLGTRQPVRRKCIPFLLFAGSSGRQINLECRPASRLGIHADVAAALFYDSIHRRQSQSGAFAFFFGSEERLEHAGLRLRVHAAAGIGHCEHHVFAGQHSTAATRVFFVQLFVPRFQSHLAAFRHGIACVDDQVH